MHLKKIGCRNDKVCNGVETTEFPNDVILRYKQIVRNGWKLPKFSCCNTPKAKSMRVVQKVLSLTKTAFHYFNIVPLNISTLVQAMFIHLNLLTVDGLPCPQQSSTTRIVF